MHIICELSKEYPSLPQDEALACFHAENLQPKSISANEDVLITCLDATEKAVSRAANRLALSYSLGELLFSCIPEEKTIQKHAKNVNITSTGSIALRYRNRSKTIYSPDIIKPLAKILTKDRNVNLSEPDIEIRVIITDSTLYVMKNIYSINRRSFEERKVHHRPFFSPISLHPKLARALVNLSQVNQTKTLLDPLCGTGGFLLEAGLIGSKVIGSDIAEKMIQGSQETLRHYGIKEYQLICADIGEISSFVQHIDAIVTDLPYGKSTTTRGEDINELASRAFHQFAEVLTENGIAVIGSYSADMLQLATKYLTLKKTYSIPVHQSLTRYFGVFKQKPKSF